jgi:signal transduction histidine kinase
MNDTAPSANSNLISLLSVSILDDIVPSFEALFGLHSVISIWNTAGHLYYGPASQDDRPRHMAPITVDGHQVGSVGVTTDTGLAQIDDMLAHLGAVLSHLAQETKRRRYLGEEVLERYDELNLIYDLGGLVAAGDMTPDRIVEVFMEEVQRILEADSGAIYLYVNVEGRRRPELRPITHFGQNRDVHYWMGRMRELALSTIHAYDEARLSDGGQVVCAPLRQHNERLGAIVLAYDHPDADFNANDIQLLTTLTQNVTLFIQTARLYQWLETRNQELEQTLTELQQARDDLSRAERLSIIGQTVSGLVHDMRNPLNIVMGYAGLLQEGDLSPEENREYATQIIRYVSDFSSMAQEILDYTQSDARVARQRVNVERYMDRVRDTLMPPGLDRAITINVDYPHTAAYAIDIDPERFTRVFQNLVNNAIDAIEEHGGSTVTITVEPDDAHQILHFRVADDGPGVPPDMVDQIFDPFVTGKARGTGLGLAIVTRMVQIHGGTIHYETSPSGGACFVFTLPLAP